MKKDDYLKIRNEIKQTYLLKNGWRLIHDEKLGNYWLEPGSSTPRSLNEAWKDQMYTQDKQRREQYLKDQGWVYGKFWDESRKNIYYGWVPKDVKVNPKTFEEAWFAQMEAEDKHYKWRPPLYIMTPGYNNTW